jgi:hypothetical protein
MGYTAAFWYIGVATTRDRLAEVVYGKAQAQHRFAPAFLGLWMGGWDDFRTFPYSILFMKTKLTLFLTESFCCCFSSTLSQFISLCFPNSDS